MDNKQTCPQCGGSGQEQDIGQSVAMGVATGLGYFPMMKQCSFCLGQGYIKKKDG